MGILIDTGVWIGYFHNDDVKATRSQGIVRDIQKGMYGKAWTTIFIVDELYTFLERKTKKQQEAITAVETVLGQKPELKPFTRIYEITLTDCLDTVKLAQKYQNKHMSFTDLSSLVACKKLGLSYIASYDKHFDGILAKIE